MRAPSEPRVNRSRPCSTVPRGTKHHAPASRAFRSSALGAVLLFLQVGCSPASQGGPSEPPSSIVLEGRYATRRITIEIADSPDEHSLGLSRRDALAPDHGMLFIFPDLRERPFWMRETHISLDIVFLDEARRIVGIVRRAKPDSDEHLTVGKPSRYVLEVEGGLCDRVGIKEGDVLAF
jgi:uncharacterized membrane protein (UPF0127 family)